MDTMEVNNTTPAATAPAAPAFIPPPTREGRLEMIQRTSTEAYSRHGDWINFFREILGPDGLVRKMFNSPEELAAFEKSEEHAAIQQMLTKLRERSGDSTEDEPTRVITVRLPKSLHESLRQEAHSRRTSMNKLCISKLLQVIAEELIPTD